MKQSVFVILVLASLLSMSYCATQANFLDGYSELEGEEELWEFIAE